MPVLGPAGQGGDWVVLQKIRQRDGPCPSEPSRATGGRETKWGAVGVEGTEGCPGVRDKRVGRPGEGRSGQAASLSSEKQTEVCAC